MLFSFIFILLIILGVVSSQAKISSQRSPSLSHASIEQTYSLNNQEYSKTVIKEGKFIEVELNKDSPSNIRMMMDSSGDQKGPYGPGSSPEDGYSYPNQDGDDYDDNYDNDNDKDDLRDDYDNPVNDRDDEHKDQDHGEELELKTYVNEEAPQEALLPVENIQGEKPLESPPPIEERHEEIIETLLPPLFEEQSEALVQEPLPPPDPLPIIIPPHQDSCSNTSNFHFPNGTCSPYCPLGTYVVQFDPLSNYSTCTQCSSNCKTCSGDPYCCTSCPLDSPYLHKKNETCLVSCPYGTIVKEDKNGTKICVANKNYRPPLPPAEKAFVQFVDNCNTVSGTLATVTMACHQIANPGASAIPSIILMVNLLGYMKYINITYPPKLDSVFNSQLSDFLSFQIPFSFPEALEDSNHTTGVPRRFLRYSVNGLFIVNMWAELMTSLIIFVLACAIGLITLTIGTRTLLGKILFWLQDFFMWNYLLVYWLSILNDIVLFAIVEYQNLDLNGTLAIVSLILNFVLFIGSLLFLSFIYYKLHQLRNKMTYKSFEDKVKSNSKFKVLFEDFKTFYFTQELMIVITSVKVILYAIIVAAFDAPVAQCVLLILLNIATMGYLLIIRPFKTGWRNIELLVYETLTFIANCACLKLALTSKDNQELAVATGDVIIITNFILISAVFLFQIISRGIQIRAYYKEKKAKKQIQPVLGTAITATTSTVSTPKAESEAVKEKLEREVKQIKEGEDQLQERRSFRRRTLRSMSTVVSLSENVRTIYIRTPTIMIQENEMNP